MKWCYRANLFLSVLWMLTGCQSLQRSPVPASQGTPADAGVKVSLADIPAALTAGALSFESLPQGRCGFLLWTVGEGRPRLVMKGGAQAGATMMIDNTQESFALVAQKGDMRYGIATHQSYRQMDTQTPMTIRVEVEFGAAFDNGVYLQNGIIVLTNTQKWERVLPAAGLAGCRPASG